VFGRRSLAAVASACVLAGCGASNATPALRTVAARHVAEKGTAMMGFAGGVPEYRPDVRRGDERPIAEEALQAGKAYPRRESWHYNGVDPSCGRIKWSYVNRIPGVDVTMDPQETGRDADSYVSFSTIPDGAATGVYHQQVAGKCTGAHPSGTLPVPTAYTIAVVRLDVGQIAQVAGKPTVLTGQTFEPVVGQFVELASVAEPDVTLRSTTWTPFPGDTVASYREKLDGASFETIVPSDYLKPKVDFYWVHGGGGRPYDIRLDAVFPVRAIHCDPTRCTGNEDRWGAADAEAKANVLAPSKVALVSRTGRIGVGKDPFAKCAAALYFGTKPGASCGGAAPGIAWSFSATAPGGGGGDLDATQLIERAPLVTDLPGAPKTAPPPQTHGQSLDQCVHYGNLHVRHQPVAANAAATWESSDSPFLSLEPAWKSLSDRDTFRVVFVYRPSDESGAPAGRTNIWVPLGHVDWYWHASAANRGSFKKPAWRLVAGQHSADPAGTTAPEPLPTWDRAFVQGDSPCPPDERGSSISLAIPRPVERR
jgi:hypothetical protein